MFQTDRQAEQIVWGSRARPLDRCAVLNQAVHSAETSSAREYTNRRCNLHGSSLRTANFNRQHCAETGHLTFSDSVARVTKQTGIVNVPDGRVVFEKGGDTASAFSLGADPIRQCVNPSERQPAVEWGWHKTSMALHVAS